jgi:hypothetical protein
MPYPNFHACRLKQPGAFEPGSFRNITQKSGGRSVQIIIGRLKGKTTTTAQTVRYPLAQWTEGEARKRCKEAGGIMFEPASGKAAHSSPTPPEIFVDDETAAAFATGGEVFEFAFVEKTDKGLWAVRRKEAKEFPDDTITLEVFDDEKIAKDYRDEVNRRKFPEGHPRNPAPSPAPSVGYARGELQTEELKGVPIFSAGSWTSVQGRKRTYTAADLDQMVSNFSKLKDKIKPFLKLMHLDEKEHRRITAKPALGWMTSVRRVGNNLVADFAKVPHKIAQLIRAGAYRRISAEIFPNFKDESTGQSFRNVLSAAGILGAVHPAVTTIDDIMKLYELPFDPEQDLVEDEEWEEEFVTAGIPVLTFYQSTYNEGGEVDMDPEEVKKLVEDTVKAALEKFETSIRETLGSDDDSDVVAEVKKLKTENSDLRARDEKREQEAFEHKRDELLAKAKQEGRIAPAAEAGLKDMLEGWQAKAADSGKFKYSLEGKEIEGTPLERFEAYLEALPKGKVKLDKEAGALSFSQARKAPPAGGIPADVLRNMGSGIPRRICGRGMAKKIDDYAREQKCDYISAFTAVTGVEPSQPPKVASYAAINENAETIEREVS